VPPNQELLDFFATHSLAGLGFPDYASLQSFISFVTGIPNPTIFDVLRSLRDDLGVLAIPDSMLVPGDGGAISATTPYLTVSGGAVSSSTGWDGNAGQVLGNFSTLLVENGGEIRSRAGLLDNTGQVFSVGNGNAGSLRLNATDTITIAGGSISTTTIGDGNGGDVFLSAGKTVNIVNGGSVSADSLALAGSGAGLTGNITINAGEQIVMTDGSVSTRAITSDGGNISMTTTGSLVHLTNSQITPSVQSGVGGGGNILIDSDSVVLDDSRVLANAFGGPGGNIDIIAKVFLVNSGGTLPTSLAGIVDASSALSTPGTINIEAAFTDVSGEVAQLPEAPLQATELLRASCAARFAGGKASSLVLGGRDGVPIQPGGLLPSPLYLATESGSSAQGVKTSAYDPPTRFSLLGSADSKNRLLNQYSLLPNFKCAL
jgi:large exoprotein involved in heme utilization and adhesion